MASSTAAANPAGARLVPCETADKKLILVEVDVLRVSRTFATMYDVLGIEECTAFPGVFPVTIIESHVFVRVINWCREHKGQPDPTVEKDAITQEEKWFEHSDFQLRFLSLPVPELLELIEAADFLDIRSLYEYGCQAIAALIKGKRQFEVRQILQQADDLSAEDIDGIFAQSPWLGTRGEFRQASYLSAEDIGHIFARCLRIRSKDGFEQVVYWSAPDIEDIDLVFTQSPWFGSKTELQDQFVDMPTHIHILPGVLVKVFQKLPRADVDRFQLVNRYFCDVIVESSEHELSEKRGPLRPVDVVLQTYLQDNHFVIPSPLTIGNSSVTCRGRDSLGKQLIFCTVRRLGFRIYGDGRSDISDELLATLEPLKSKWKNATIDVALSCFSSTTSFEFAFTELFICKEIRMEIQARFEPQPFMHLPAILNCNKLTIRNLDHSVSVNDVVEWLEREKPGQWSEPSYLEVPFDKIIGGFAGLIDALKKAFLDAARPNPYIVRIVSAYRRPIDDDRHHNEKTKEQMTIKRAKWDYVGRVDFGPGRREWGISVERKQLD